MIPTRYAVLTALALAAPAAAQTCAAPAVKAVAAPAYHATGYQAYQAAAVVKQHANYDVAATLVVPALPDYFATYIAPPPAAEDQKADGTADVLKRLVERLEALERRPTVLPQTAPAEPPAADGPPRGAAILSASCLKCHTGPTPKGDFLIDPEVISRNDARAMLGKVEAGRVCSGQKPPAPADTAALVAFLKTRRGK